LSIQVVDHQAQAPIAQRCHYHEAPPPIFERLRQAEQPPPNRRSAASCRARVMTSRLFDPAHAGGIEGSASDTVESGIANT